MADGAEWGSQVWLPGSDGVIAMPTAFAATATPTFTVAAFAASAPTAFAVATLAAASSPAFTVATVLAAFLKLG